MQPLGMSQVQWADIEPGLCMGYSGLFARLDDCEAWSALP